MVLLRPSALYLFLLLEFYGDSDVPSGLTSPQRPFRRSERTNLRQRGRGRVRAAAGPRGSHVRAELRGPRARVTREPRRRAGRRGRDVVRSAARASSGFVSPGVRGSGTRGPVRAKRWGPAAAAPRLREQTLRCGRRAGRSGRHRWGGGRREGRSRPCADPTPAKAGGWRRRPGPAARWAGGKGLEGLGPPSRSQRWNFRGRERFREGFVGEVLS